MSEGIFDQGLQALRRDVAGVQVGGDILPKL